MTRLNQNCHRRMVMFLVLAVFFAFSGLAQAAPWSFAVLGDQRDQNGSTGVNAPVIQSMVKDIESRGVSLALVGGDQIHAIYGGSSASLPTMYRNWRAAMGRLLRISYPVRGNHEICGERSVPYYPYYWRKCVVQLLPQIPQNGPSGEKGMTYSLTKQAAFFAGMDEFIPGNENRVNQGWLDQQLSANILPLVFVYGHEPAVALDPVLPNMSYYPLDRDAFWEILSEAGARVYFCGHHHLYNRATVTITDVNGQTTNPITQLVVGGGGAPYEPWNGNYYPYLAGGGQPEPTSPEWVTTTMNNHLESQYGYSIVTVNGNQVSVAYYAGRPAGGAVPTSWQLFETFDYTVSSKTLGLKDVSQAINPQILNDFYPGIAINKIGAGTLTLNAGTSNYSEPITISAGQMSVYGAYAGAPVSVNGGGKATLYGGSLNNVTVDAGGNLAGSGTVEDLANNGCVCPDLITGPWNLNVNGNFTQTATGSFNVDITSATNYGYMQVNGAANLSGGLYVSMPTSYSPTVGQIFSNVITAANGLTGTFGQIISNPPNIIWQANQTSNSLSLQVLQVSPGSD
ncbi:MAG: metallophosphoesterase family protein [Syntrophobacteraceae bacterium]